MEACATIRRENMRHSANRSSTTLLAVLFVAALATQSCQNFLQFAFSEDQFYQASAGQGWRDGHGFTVPVLRSSGFDRAPLVGFPPGFSMFYAAAIGVGGTPFWAAFLLNTLTAVIFCAAGYALLAVLAPGIGAPAGLAVAAYWAVAWNPLVSLPASDTLSLALFVAGIAIVIHTIRARRPVAWTIVAGFAAGTAAAVRFAYWPLVAVPLILVLLIPRAGRIARVLAFAAPPALLLGGSALVNVRSSGALTTVLGRMSHVLYWRNILDTTPFGAEAFGFETAWDRLAIAVPALAPVVPIALWAVTIFVLVIAVDVSIRDLRGAGDPGLRLFSAATLLTLVVTAALIASLGLLTPPAADGWTLYREASRYLEPVYLFLTVAVVRAAADRRRAVALLAIAMLTIGGASVVVYRAGQLRMTLTKNREVYPSGPQTRAWLASLHRTVRAEVDRGRFVLYCDPDLTREYFAVMSGAVAPRGGCSAADAQSAIAAGGTVLLPSAVPGTLPTTPSSVAR